MNVRAIGCSSCAAPEVGDPKARKELLFCCVHSSRLISGGIWGTVLPFSSLSRLSSSFSLCPAPLSCLPVHLACALSRAVGHLNLLPSQLRLLSLRALCSCPSTPAKKFFPASWRANGDRGGCWCQNIVTTDCAQDDKAGRAGTSLTRSSHT